MSIDTTCPVCNAEYDTRHGECPNCVAREYLPDHPIWLLFGLSNGHAPTKRYVWWFDTKRDALRYRAHHYTYPNAAPLSKPVRFEPSKGRG